MIADTTRPDAARLAWQTLEPCHAMIYFAPEAREAFTELGLKGYWMGYFASRGGALGAVSAPVIEATFFGFAPAMVARAIPDAWGYADPAQVLAARTRAAGAALERLWADRLEAPELREAADLLRTAAGACRVSGRPLFAGHVALPWPAEPHIAIWHGATLLREFRGDGHVAALVAEELDGCQSHVLQVAHGHVPREAVQSRRGWDDEAWEAAEADLRRRGLVGEDGALTTAGHDVRQRVEDRTDALALQPWRALGDRAFERLLELTRPLSQAIVDAEGLPEPNPMGYVWQQQGGTGGVPPQEGSGGVPPQEG
jgi:hypothetical protein